MQNSTLNIINSCYVYRKCLMCHTNICYSKEVSEFITVVYATGII